MHPRFINQKLRLCGQSHRVAAFRGHFYDRGQLQLVYRHEGALTLDQALKGRDFPWNVESALQHGQNGRLGGAIAVQHGLLRLHLKA